MKCTQNYINLNRDKTTFFLLYQELVFKNNFPSSLFNKTLPVLLICFTVTHFVLLKNFKVQQLKLDAVIRRLYSDKCLPLNNTDLYKF